MKSRRVINIVEHKLTGAKIPMEVLKVNDKNEIEKYREFTKDRKGFTIAQLIDRWKKPKHEVMEILEQYQIPGHFRKGDMSYFIKGQFPIDSAIFFEEYIAALEKKAKIKHNKLKSKVIE